MFRDAPYQNVNPACREVRCSLRAFYDQRQRERTHPMKLIERVAADHKLGVKDILNDDRRPEIMAVRKLCAFVIQGYRPDFSAARIGAHMDRDQSTMRYMLGRTARARRRLEERKNR